MAVVVVAVAVLVATGARVGVLDGVSVGVAVRVAVGVCDALAVGLPVGVDVKATHCPLLPSQVAPKTTVQLPQPPVAGPHTSGLLHWQQSAAPGVRVGVGTTTTIAPLLPIGLGSG